MKNTLLDRYLHTDRQHRVVCAFLKDTPKTQMIKTYGVEDASFLAAGGRAGIKKLVDRFYAVMEELPEARVIRAMHPEDLILARDKLTLFLCGWLGGEKLFSKKYGPIVIPRAHAHLDIGERERDAWLTCMRLAVEEQDYAPDFKDYLMAQLYVPAERCRLASEERSSQVTQGRPLSGKTTKSGAT